MLFGVDGLLPSGKAILNRTKDKGYLSVSLKSTVLPDSTDQDMLAMILRFTSKMDVSLPIFIFAVLPVFMNRFRLFLFIRLLNDVTPLIRRSCIKQSLSSFPACLIYSKFRTWMLSSTGTPELILYTFGASKSGLKGLR